MPRLAKHWARTDEAIPKLEHGKWSVGREGVFVWIQGKDKGNWSATFRVRIKDPATGKERNVNLGSCGKWGKSVVRMAPGMTGEDRLHAMGKAIAAERGEIRSIARGETRNRVEVSWVRTMTIDQAVDKAIAAKAMTLMNRAEKLMDNAVPQPRTEEDVRVRGAIMHAVMGPDFAPDNAARIEPDRQASEDVPTLTEALDEVIDLYKRTERHKQMARRRLEMHVLPAIGHMSLDQIDHEHLARVLKPLYEKPGTARSVKGDLNHVFRVAVAKKWVRINVAKTFDTILLPKLRSVEHHPAVPLNEARDVFRQIPDTETGRALRFCILTATRKREASEAEWHEVDLGRRIWTIPRDRTKTRTPFRVPLSDEAIRCLGGPGDGRAFDLSHQYMARVMRKLHPTGTVHGWRSIFKDWAGDVARIDVELAFRCLGHKDTPMRRAYARSDMLDQRREVMDAWAEWLTSSESDV